MSEKLSERVRAPWTADQVASLHEYQFCGRFHPLTCGKCKGSPLYVEIDGWHCHTCDYTQDWAHDFMANWKWKIAALESRVARAEDSLATVAAERVAAMARAETAERDLNRTMAQISSLESTLLHIERKAWGEDTMISGFRRWVAERARAALASLTDGAPWPDVTNAPTRSPYEHETTAPLPDRTAALEKVAEAIPRMRGHDNDSDLVAAFRSLLWSSGPLKLQLGDGIWNRAHAALAALDELAP